MNSAGLAFFARGVGGVKSRRSPAAHTGTDPTQRFFPGENEFLAPTLPLAVVPDALPKRPENTCLSNCFHGEIKASNVSVVLGRVAGAAGLVASIIFPDIPRRLLSSRIKLKDPAMRNPNPSFRRPKTGGADLHQWWGGRFASLIRGGVDERDAAEAMLATAVARLSDLVSPREAVSMLEQLSAFLANRADLADDAVRGAFGGTDDGQDDETVERRSALLRRLYGPITSIELEGDPSEAALDLASVLLSFGLSISDQNAGAEVTAGHLSRLARLWARKCAGGPKTPDSGSAQAGPVAPQTRH